MSIFVEKYFPKFITNVNKKGYLVKYELNLNEMPLNLPLELRKKIIKRLQKISFNKYPEPFGQSIVGLLANFYGVKSYNVMVAPGSSAFIRLLLSYFAINCKGKIVITRPSFTYYEQYCNNQNIAFETWNLDSNFNYVPEEIENLPNYSIVFLTTPNNPTGNTIQVELMDKLLITHPKSLFVVDEAYAEFVDETMLPLIKKYDNLIILRTFSKAFSAAGIRCGILFAQKDMIASLMGIQTPWQLSSFTIESVKAIFEFVGTNTWFEDQIKAVISKREILFNKLSKIKSNKYTFYPSKANFLMLKSQSDEDHKLLMEACAKIGILIKDLTEEPRLKNFARVTIGSNKGNNAFYKVIKNLNINKEKYEK